MAEGRVQVQNPVLLVGRIVAARYDDAVAEWRLDSVHGADVVTDDIVGTAPREPHGHQRQQNDHESR